MLRKNWARRRVVNENLLGLAMTFFAKALVDMPARLACNEKDPRLRLPLATTLETHLLTRRLLRTERFLRGLLALLRAERVLRVLLREALRPPKIGRPPEGRPETAFMTAGVKAAPRRPQPAECVASPRVVPTSALGTIFSDVY